MGSRGHPTKGEGYCIELCSNMAPHSTGWPYTVINAVQWLDAYPNAKGYICPGGKKKYPDVSYSQELSEDNQSPPEWLGEIEPTFLSYEAVPVLNIPFFNEVTISAILAHEHCVWEKPGDICLSIVCHVISFACTGAC